MTAIITSTGAKGLLQWIKATQPEFYAYLSPRLIQAAKGLSGLRGLDCLPPMKMGSMGDAYSNAYFYSSYASMAPPITSTSDLNMSNPGFQDLTIAPSTTDAATAATSAPASPGLAQAIGAIAQGYSSATLTAAQVSANNTLLQTNLQRAQQGLPPLSMATASTGLTSLTSNSGLLLLGLAAAVALAMGSKKSSSA